MATRFQSAAQRGYWLGFLFALLTDFALAFVVGLFLATNAVEAVGLALLFLVSAYVFQILYGLWSLARAAALFFLFEKKRRIDATIGQMATIHMPRPDSFYSEPTDYLLEVANSKEAPDEARLFAGVTIGSIETLRNTSRPFLTMSLLMVLEGAIEGYGHRFVIRQTDYGTEESDIRL